MKLIEDLGVANNKIRYGVYECPNCLQHIKFNTYAVTKGNSTKCNTCANISRNNAKRENARSKLVARVEEIHGNTLTVNPLDYMNNTTKIPVVCSIHGTFYKAPANLTHKSNPQGCPRCTAMYLDTSDFCLFYKRFSIDTPVTLYYVQIGEDLWKVGCTKYDVARRFRMDKDISITEIFSKECSYGGDAYRIEQHILNRCKNYKYYGEQILYKGHGDSELLIFNIIGSLEDLIKEAEASNNKD